MDYRPTVRGKNSGETTWSDREADVLYMSFRKPQGATKTIEPDEDTLVRKDGRTIVGLTILNASTKQRPPGGEAL
jgi:uncharacterized protein YuzE